MKSKAFVAVLAAVVLTGCAMHGHHGDRGGPRADRLHAFPMLTVRHGVISVAPDPIVIKRSEDKGPLTFLAPAGYTFPAKDGIEFLGIVTDRQGNPVLPDPRELKNSGFELQVEARNAFSCRASDSRREFICDIVPERLKKGIYRYAMRLQDSSGKLIESDPSVFSME